MIVGFSKLGGPKRLFHHRTPDSPAELQYPAQLNAYLADAPDVFIWNRSIPISDVPRIGVGNKPIDGGNYLFTPEEKDAFLADEPGAEKYFHRWMGSKEFIRGIERWVLWLGDANPSEIAKMPTVMERVRAVRDFRLASKSTPTQKLANTPMRFHVENTPEGNSILIPQTSSQRRKYIPLGYVGPEVLCSNGVRLIPDATLYHFGILQSQFHMAWMRRTTGRLKSDYQYAANIVYNNFVWPDLSRSDGDRHRKAVEDAAQAVLDARADYPESAIAEMYDPDNDFLFPRLSTAHSILDTAVESAYGVTFNGDEQQIVQLLFDELRDTES